MLEVLHIENIAIIEEADIRFEAGFNALTGETGAGKSIVIDALSAVLGQRTSRELIRTGADKAFVSAVFSGVDSAIAEEQGVTPEEDGSLLLQREIHSDGKSVCRVGGRPVTVGQLKALGSRLLNIHGSTTASSFWTRSSICSSWIALESWKALLIHMLKSIIALQRYNEKYSPCRWTNRKKRAA